MSQQSETADIIAKIIGNSCVEVIQRSTGESVYLAPSVQRVPSIHLRPDIGCFVQFGGDYAGLVILNFDAETALYFYRTSMMFMGMPEEELVNDSSHDEVLDSLGELVNQIVGQVRQQIQRIYGLSAVNKQPKAIAIQESILLSVKDTIMAEAQCRRLSFKLREEFPFHVEFFIEQTEFASIGDIEIPA